MEQEQLNTNQQVVGSNPTVSSIYCCLLLSGLCQLTILRLATDNR